MQNEAWPIIERCGANCLRHPRTTRRRTDHGTSRQCTLSAQTERKEACIKPYSHSVNVLSAGKCIWSASRRQAEFRGRVRTSATRQSSPWLWASSMPLKVKYERTSLPAVPGQLDDRLGHRPQSGSTHRPYQARAEVEDDPWDQERGAGRARHDAAQPEPRPGHQSIEDDRGRMVRGVDEISDHAAQAIEDH